MEKKLEQIANICVALLWALFLIYLTSMFVSCKSEVKNKEVDTGIVIPELLPDTIGSVYRKPGTDSIFFRFSDSIKIAQLKQAFSAGYKKGVSTGINNCDASIEYLNTKAKIDSILFAIDVDKIFGQ